MKEPRPLDPLTSPGYQVRRAHRKFDRELAGRLAQHGLRSGYWYYLRVLWIEDGLTQRELSEATNVAESTTATLIEGMIREGLVSRTRDGDDRRKMRIMLTDKGRALHGDLIGIAHEINVIACSGIAPADIAICLRVLDALSQNLDERCTRMPVKGDVIAG